MTPGVLVPDDPGRRPPRGSVAVTRGPTVAGFCEAGPSLKTPHPQSALLFLGIDLGCPSVRPARGRGSPCRDQRPG